MRSRRFCLKRAIVLIALAIVGALLWRPIREGLAVATLNEAAKEADVQYSTTRGGPLPGIEDAAFNSIDWISKTSGGRVAGDTRFWKERFRSLYCGPIERIRIWDMLGGPPKNIGSTLKYFPDLRELDVRLPLPSGEWLKLCQTIRGLPRLEQLKLSGDHITDATIAALAGHNSLQSINLGRNAISPAAMITFATMPHLETVILDEPHREAEDLYGRGRAATPNEWVQFCNGFRNLPRLRLLIVEGAFSDEAVTQLAGHACIEGIWIRGDHTLTPACYATFAALPHLEELTIRNRNAQNKERFSEAERSALTKMLPRVHVEFD